jgi:hypothetical protein
MKQDDYQPERGGYRSFSSRILPRKMDDFGYWPGLKAIIYGGWTQEHEKGRAVWRCQNGVAP